MESELRNKALLKLYFPVIWNPWSDQAREMGDLGDDEYPNMLCVEAGHVSTPVILLPGTAFEASQILQVNVIDNLYRNVLFGVQMKPRQRIPLQMQMMRSLNGFILVWLVLFVLFYSYFIPIYYFVVFCTTKFCFVSFSVRSVFFYLCMEIVLHFQNIKNTKKRKSPACKSNKTQKNQTQQVMWVEAIGATTSRKRNKKNKKLLSALAVAAAAAAAAGVSSQSQQAAQSNNSSSSSQNIEQSTMASAASAAASGSSSAAPPAQNSPPPPPLSLWQMPNIFWNNFPKKNTNCVDSNSCQQQSSANRM